MKLHLGCGNIIKEGYENVDCIARVDVVRVVDLNDLPWPWQDNSISEIFAQDILEHLYPLGKCEAQMNIVGVMEEIYRVLEPNGVLEAIIPTTEGRGAFQDPTHVTFWNPNTLSYFIDGQRPAEFADYNARFEQDGEIQFNMLEESFIVWMEFKLRKVG